MGRRYDNSVAFFEQYGNGPFGAQRSIPTSRRNPWYNDDSLWLPDTTQVRSVFETAPAPWDDPTEVRSALVPGPYGRANPRKGRKSRKNSSHQRTQAAAAMKLFRSGKTKTLKAAWAQVKRNPGRYPSHESDYSARDWAVYEQHQGQYGINEAFTKGIVPYGRRNPGGVQFTSNGQPYVVEMVNGRKRARFIKRSAAARPNMAGRPGKYGLPMKKVGKGQKARAMALLGVTDLTALAEGGDKSAVRELARRAASRKLRAGIASPAARAAKRKPAKGKKVKAAANPHRSRRSRR